MRLVSGEGTGEVEAREVERCHVAAGDVARDAGPCAEAGCWFPRGEGGVWGVSGERGFEGEEGSELGDLSAGGEGMRNVEEE